MADTTYHTSNGTFVLDVSRDQKMASGFEKNKYNQAGDIALLKKLLTKESVVVDIGAHIGTMTIPFARLVNKVIAFEPIAESAAYLQKNLTLNNLHNVEIRRMALGKEKGEAAASPVTETNAGGYSLHTGNDFPVETLDSQVDFASFIKIDVEGLEPDVLAGAHSLLAKYHPAVYFEINLPQLRRHNSGPLKKIGSLLRSHQYKIYLPVGNVLCRVRSLALVSFAMEPRAYVFGGPSGTFDLLALYQKPNIPVIKFSTVWLFQKGLLKILKKIFGF